MITKFSHAPWYGCHFANPNTKCSSMEDNVRGCRYVLNDSYAGSIADIQVDNGKHIADGGNDAPPVDEARANARLIMVAPELYLVLRGIASTPDLLLPEVTDKIQQLLGYVDGINERPKYNKETV